MRRRFLFTLLVALCAFPAAAQETIKVGVIAAFSGPFADIGRQMEAGIKTYFQVNGDTVAGRKIEIILRDTTGPSPDIAKRHAQDLILRDKVDFLAGFSLTPEALAVAPVATEAKKPMIIMNAATSIITTKSPYIARVSMTLAQVASPMGTWAFKSGIRKVISVVTDYGPGIDAETAFKASFTAAGGQILESLRVPLQNPDFGPFIQRVKDAKPEAVFVFVPAGGQGIAFMKAFQERGLADVGIKVIATGDLTDDHLIDSMGDPALNVVTSFHYSASHDAPENRAFQKAYLEANGPQAGRPNFVAVAAYDGMAAIAEVVKRLGGVIDGDKAMEVLKGMKINSPRGPIVIDAQTRDVVQTVYIRRVERVNGQLYNIEFEKFPDIRDPGKP